MGNGIDGGKLMELKSCPFCGSKKVGVAETSIGNYQNIFFLARCDECGARTKLFRDRDKAEEAWNMRADNVR